MTRAISDSHTGAVREAGGSEDEDVNKQPGQSGSETQQRVVMCFCAGEQRVSQSGSAAVVPSLRPSGITTVCSNSLLILHAGSCPVE